MFLLELCKIKQEGVKCFDCPNRETCVQLNPPKPKPKLYDSPTLEKQPFQPVPTDTLDKSLYRMLLLMAEDFMLTSVEKHELIFYGARFNPFSKKGGRGKSKERIFAYLCIHLLERDGRSIIFNNDQEYYIERYNLNLPDSEKMKKFVQKEIKRIRI